MKHVKDLVAATATPKQKRKLHEQQLIALGAKPPRYMRGKQPYKMLKGMRAAAQQREARQSAYDREAGNVVPNGANSKRRKREHQEESLSRADYVNVVRGDRSGLRRTVGDGSRGFRPTSVGSFRNGVLRIKARDIANITGGSPSSSASATGRGRGGPGSPPPRKKPRHG